MFKANNKNSRLRSDVLIVNFEHISPPFSSVPIVDFEQVNVTWDALKTLTTLFENLDINTVVLVIFVGFSGFTIES